MKIDKLANLFEFKYASQLIDPNLEDPEIRAQNLDKIKNNIAELYRRFMVEYSGNIAQLKQVYKLPHLEAIHTLFSRLVANIDYFEAEQINRKVIEIIEQIEEARIKLNDDIKLNKDDPAAVAAFMRKRLASSVEKALHELQIDLKRQLEYFRGNARVFEKVVPKVIKRRRMKQTPQQQEMFVLRFGDLYGINNMQDWGKLIHQDLELSEEVMTAFLGLNRAARDFKKDEYYDPNDPKNKQKELAVLKSKIKPNLVKKVNKFFGREI